MIEKSSFIQLLRPKQQKQNKLEIIEVKIR